MQKISVIVPVYNTSKYLVNCLNSIREQSFVDFEVILVDDGSQDSSIDICEAYAKVDKRFKVVQQKNSGVTLARKNGVMESSCEWICFVDSDDTLPHDSLQNLYSHVNKNVDIIIGCIKKKDFENYIITIHKYRSEMILGTILPGPVAKLFRRQLFDDSIFDIPREIVKGEDMLMNIRLSFKTHKDVAFINKIVYNYLYHSESSSHRFLSTIEYEDWYHRLRIESIPSIERNNYVKECVEAGLAVWNSFCGYSYKVPTNWKKTYLYCQLIQDIKRSSYKISLIDNLLLNWTNPYFRFFLITIKKVNMFLTKWLQNN